MPRFEELEFHENFEDHQAAAGRRVVTESEAIEVWDGQRLMVPNRSSGRGRYLMAGLTSARRPVTVVLLEGATDGAWVAYTAWDTKHTDR